MPLMKLLQRKKPRAQKNLHHALLFLLFVLLTGILGYRILEEWSFLDSLYMTLISVTTTGFKEVHPLSDGGKIFTLILIVVGFSTLAYAAGRGAQYFFEEEIFFGRTKMTKKVEKFNNHTIVCGYGRMGREICEELADNDSPFVVVDKNEEAISVLEEKGYPYFVGDAVEDEALIKAGIEKARALIAVLSSDADNVFLVLSARGLNRNLKILARAETESSQRKLIKAGADKVVLPYLLGGKRIAMSLVKPAVMDFFEMLIAERRFELSMEQVELSVNSELCDLELQKTFIRSDLDIIIVAIQRSDGEIIYNPGGKTQLRAGDKLLAIGKNENLQILEKVAVP
jgi:voltage-gated potassium channel